jgi:hypothetical protein
MQLLTLFVAGAFVVIAPSATPALAEERTEMIVRPRLAGPESQGARPLPPCRLAAWPAGHRDGESTVEPLRAPVARGEGLVRLALPVGTLWSLRFECPGLWSMTEAVFVADPTEVWVRLWPRALLTGRIAVARGERLPKSLMVRLTPTLDRQTRAAGSGLLPETTISCPVDEGRWSCAIPATPLDVRLRASGFVSHYLWGVRPEPGAELSIGTLALVRGASLSGWVVAEDEAKVGDVRVTLSPQTGPVSEATHEATAVRSLTESADERGFFHFEGIPPGRFIVQARRGDHRSGEVALTVLPDQEAVLRESLVLQPLMKLEVRLEPPLDPWGKPWEVKLREGGDFSAVLGIGHPVRSTEIEGRFRVEKLPAGDITLRVADHRGTVFLMTSHPVDPDHRLIDLEVPVLAVTGRVTLGREPLAARLWFGTRRGAVSIPATSDDEGEFSGFLPRPGSWVVEVEGIDRRIRRALETEVEPGEDGEAVVEIELPDTVFEGTVVTELGEPIEGALVSPVFIGPEAEPVPSIFTDELGLFHYEGLSPGPIFVEAQTSKLATGTVLVFVPQEGRTAPVRLVARPIRIVRGVVRSPQGPVAGAQITIQTVGHRLNPSGDLTTTDGQGEFQFRLPQAVGEVLIGVLAPGFAVRTYRTPVGDDPLIIPVDSLGGDLLLAGALDEAGTTPWSDRSIFVLHQGSSLLFTRLFQWALLHGERVGPDGVLRVPMVEPGEYTACLGSYLEMERSLLGGGLVERCASGILHPLGELRLAIPGKT